MLVSFVMGHYGIVYIARNDKHPPNVYKVGGSSRDVDERMRELSNETATYGTFESKATFPVTDWEAAEAQCHRQLNEYRDDKEFFKAPYNELVEVVRNVCDDYQPERNVEQPTDGMSKAPFLKETSPERPDFRVINCGKCGEKIRVPNRTVKAACPHCGNTFQSEGVSAARADWEDHVDWDSETKTFIPKPVKQAPSTSQYVSSEQTTDHADKSGSPNNHLWVIGAAVTSIGAALFTGSNVVEKIWGFVAILFWWGLTYWVVGKFKSGAWNWRIAAPIVLAAAIYVILRALHEHSN